jgi:DNA-binding CsgD family transcriptional regulator
MGVNLSRREIECLEWTAVGKNAPEIAIILGITPSTVRWYFKQVMAKLDVTTKAQAVSVAIGLE